MRKDFFRWPLVMRLQQLNCLYSEIPWRLLHPRPRQDQEQRVSRPRRDEKNYVSKVWRLLIPTLRDCSVNSLSDCVQWL